MGEGENNAKKDVVVEPDTTDTTAESSKLLSQAGNDATYKQPTASPVETGQSNPEVQRILEKFHIAVETAGSDTTWSNLVFSGGEKITGSRKLSHILANRDGSKQPTDGDGRPITNGELNMEFRALVNGALNPKPPKAPMSLEDIKNNLNNQFKRSGFEVKLDQANPDRLTLVDNANLVPDPEKPGQFKPREVSRFDTDESAKEFGDRMANRTLDPTITVGQQESLVKYGLTPTLAKMSETERVEFLAEYNKRMDESGSNQRLEFKDGKATLIPPSDATLPKGLRLENVDRYTDLRDAINDGDLSAQDVLDQLKESTADLDPRQARLFNAETTKLLQQKYGSEFSIRADQNGQNQKLEVQLSKQPPIKVDVPAGMSMEDAQQWVKSAGELQKISGSPAETYQKRLSDFMESEPGKKLLEAFGNLPDEGSKRQFIDGVNRLVPENVKGDFQFGLSADGKGMDLNRPGDAFKLRFGNTKLDTFLPPADTAARDAAWERKPAGVSEDNRKAYLDAITGLKNEDTTIRGNALRALRDTVQNLPVDQQKPFLDGINNELRDAKIGFRVTNTDGRVEARQTLVLKGQNGEGQDVTVPRHLAGDPARVDAFKQIAQGILDGKDPTELSRAINDLSNTIMSAGKGDFFNSLNGLLAQKHPDLRFQENGLQVKGGMDAQGQQIWRSVPEGVDLSDASQLGKTIPAGLDGDATTKFQQLVESLGQNPSEIFNQQRLDQIKSDLSRLDPEQAKIYRDQINAKLGDKFKLNDSGQLVAKTNHGDVPIPNGLNGEQAEIFRGLAERALTPGSTPASLANDLMSALKPPMTASQQKSFLDGFNEQFKKTHGDQYFTQNGSDLNLNQSQLLPSWASNPVLDTFKGDAGKAAFDSLLRSADFENPGANPKVEAIRDSFTKLRDNPTDAQAMKDLLTQLNDSNFSPEQINALQRAFQADKPDNPPLKIGKDGVIQVGDTTLIRTSSGAFMSVTGNMSLDAAQNLKYAAEQISPQNPMSAFTAKNISEILKSVTDPTVRSSIVESFNSFLTASGSKEQIAAHPGGDGIDIARKEHGIETNRWVKGTGVEATAAEVATNAMDRLVQNPTDGKALVEALERNPDALTRGIENLVDKNRQPFSAEVEAKLQSLYQFGSTDTKRTIERSLAVVGADKELADRLGISDNALKIIEFSNRIKTKGLDSVGTQLSEFLAKMTPTARAEAMADLRSSVEVLSGLGHTLAFNDKNELVLKEGNTVKDGYPNGVLGQILDTIRAKTDLKDPYIIANIAQLADAFNQIKAKDPAGLKTFLELSTAKLDSEIQAKLLAGLNEHFGTQVSMNDQGVITDGTNSFKLAEVNGKAMAVPASLSSDLIGKLGNRTQLVDALTSLANSGDISQLRALLQVGNPDFNDAVKQALLNSNRTDTAALAGDLRLPQEVQNAAAAHDAQVAFQNEILGTMASASPEAAARLAAEFAKLKTALSSGDPAAALKVFADATKGNLNAALIDKLNTQLQGFRLAFGTDTLALAKVGGDNSYVASVSTADAVVNTSGLFDAKAAGEPTLTVYNPGEVTRVGLLRTEVNAPILEMPKDPALPQAVMSQLYGLALETRLEFQEALKRAKTPAEREQAIRTILEQKGLDIMRHATSSENGMNLAQRQAFVEAMNKFLLNVANTDGFKAELKDYRYKLSGDVTNASLTLEGNGVSLPLSITESNNRLFEQRLGTALGLDVTQHGELKDAIRGFRQAGTDQEKTDAYKALLTKMTSLNLTPDQMKKMVATLEDPKLKFVESTGTISFDGPPPLNLKHFKAVTGDFYVPGDLTKTQFDTLRGYIAGFADNRNSFVTGVDKFRLFLGQLKPEQRDAVIKATEHALNFRRWGLQGEVKLSIEGSNLIVDGGLTYKREWAITTDAAAPRRPEIQKLEVDGKQYDLPPNLTDAQKNQLKGVIRELGIPPAGAITQAVRDQIAALLKDVPLGTARAEMLKAINSASGELQKTAFTLDGTKLSIVTDGKPVTPPIDIPTPTAGPADLASAMKELQALINCNVNPDTGLMRKAISDVARLFAKEKGANFNPQELARLMNTVGMENFKFSVDTSKPGQTEIVVTDKSGAEINRINTRELLLEAAATAPAVVADNPAFKLPDLSQVPPEKLALAEAIFKATNIQDLMKAIKAAKDGGLTQFKIGNDTYRIDVKGLGSGTALVHMTINGKIAVKAVERNGVFHPQSDGKFFGSAYVSKNPDSPIALRAREMKLTTPQEVATAIQSGALTTGRPLDGPVSPQQVQERLKELGLNITDTVKAQAAFTQIQDLQNALKTSNPAEIRKALAALKGNGDVNPQMAALIAKINENPANALKIEGDAIKLQIGTAKYDIPENWSPATVRNITRLATTDAVVAANLHKYLTDTQIPAADKGAILRSLLGSITDNAQASKFMMEVFKQEKSINPGLTLTQFADLFKGSGEQDQKIEYKNGALVLSDKARAVRATISETDAKSAFAAGQLRNLFDASLPGTDPKKPDFNPNLLPKAAKIAELLRDLTPAERTKAIADLKTDLQAKGVRLDITAPNTSSPMVELTYENATRQQFKDSAKIADAVTAAVVPPEQQANTMGDALNAILSRNPVNRADVDALLKTWADKINTSGVDRAAFVRLIQQRLGSNGTLEVTGTGADTKLVFNRTGMEKIELPLGAPREVTAATGPRTDVPALTDITGVPADKAPLVQAIYAANDINAMLAAIKVAKAAGITQFKIGNDVIGLQVIGVGKGTSLIHMTVNGKIGVKAVDRNGTFTPQMDGKFFGSNHGNPLLSARSEQWKLRTPQEVTTTLRAGTVRPGDTTVGATVPIAPLTDQQIKDGLLAVGITNIPDTAKARAAFTQIQDLQNALRTANPIEARRLLTALKANTDIGTQFPTLVGKINETTGTNGALKIDGDTIKMQIGDTKYIIPDNWDANTVRNLSRLASADAVTAVRIHNYITESQKPGADKAAVLKTLLTATTDSAIAGNILLEVFKRESALNPGLTLEQFRNNFQKSAPEGWNLKYEGNALVLKDNKNIARVTIPESGARIAVASQALQNLIDVTAPGLDPKKPNFNSALVPKAEKIAEILKGLTSAERIVAMKDITAALAERNLRVALTGTEASPMVEVSFDTSRGRAVDAKRIGDAATPANPEQTALAMGTRLKEILGNPATTDAQLSDYLKTITGQLNAPGVDRAAFLRQIQAQIDAGTPPKIKLDIAGTGADTKLVLKRDGKADVSTPLVPRDIAATTTGDTRPFAEQLKSLSDYLKLPNPPTREVLDRMLKSLALAHARSTNPPSFDNAAFIAATKLDGTGYNLVNDTSKTPPELVLKKGEAVVSSPIKASDVIAATSAPDKTTTSILELANARGIDVSKIPLEGTLQRELFEALLRGKSGKELTLLIKDLYAKGLKTPFTLPDANGKERKIILQVDGHYVHMFAADDSGRMRIAIRGTTDGRPQRGGYLGTRWSESMVGKTIIGIGTEAAPASPDAVLQRNAKALEAYQATLAESIPKGEATAKFAEFAKANADNPELIKQALKATLQAQFKVTPDGKLTEIANAYTVALKAAGLEALSVAANTDNSIELKVKTPGGERSLGKIDAKEFLPPTRVLAEQFKSAKTEAERAQIFSKYLRAEAAANPTLTNAELVKRFNDTLKAAGINNYEARFGPHVTADAGIQLFKIDGGKEQVLARINPADIPRGDAKESIQQVASRFAETMATMSGDELKRHFDSVVASLKDTPKEFRDAILKSLNEELAKRPETKRFSVADAGDGLKLTDKNPETGTATEFKARYEASDLPAEPGKPAEQSADQLLGKLLKPEELAKLDTPEKKAAALKLLTSNDPLKQLEAATKLFEAGVKNLKFVDANGKERTLLLQNSPVGKKGYAYVHVFATDDRGQSRIWLRALKQPDGSFTKQGKANFYGDVWSKRIGANSYLSGKPFEGAAAPGTTNGIRPKFFDPAQIDTRTPEAIKADIPAEATEAARTRPAFDASLAVKGLIEAGLDGKGFSSDGSWSALNATAKFETIKRQLQEYSKEQLEQLKAEYKKATGVEFNEALKQRFSGPQLLELEQLSQGNYDRTTQMMATLADLDQWFAGKSKDQLQKLLRDSFSSLTADQIAKLESQFKERNGGKSLFEEIKKRMTTVFGYTNAEGQLMDIYFKGVDKRTPEDVVKLAEHAMYNVYPPSIERFKEAFINAPPGSAEAFKAKYGTFTLWRKFGGFVDQTDLNQAWDVIEKGKVSTATEIYASRGFLWNSTDSMNAAIDKMSPEERKAYSEGRAYIGKSQAEINALPEAERKKYEYAKGIYDQLMKTFPNAYLTGISEKSDVYNFLKAEDRIKYGKDGSLVSKVLGGWGTLYDSSSDSIISQYIENMSKDDFDRARDPVTGKQLRADMERALGAYLSRSSVEAIMKAYDAKIGFDKSTGTYADKAYESSQARSVEQILDDKSSFAGIGADGAGMLEAVLRMSPADQQRFKTDESFRKLLYEKVKESWSLASYQREAALRVLERFEKTGELKTELQDDIAMLRSRSAPAKDYVAALEKAFADPAFKAKLDADPTLKDSISWAMWWGMGNDPYEKYAKPFLNNGSLDIRTKAELFRSGIMGDSITNLFSDNDFQSLIDSIKSSPAKDKQDLINNAAEILPFLTKEQQELVKKIAQQDGQIKPEDRIRAAIITGKPEIIRQVAESMRPEDRILAREAYEKAFGDLLVNKLIEIGKFDAQMASRLFEGPKTTEQRTMDAQDEFAANMKGTFWAGLMGSRTETQAYTRMNEIIAAVGKANADGTDLTAEEQRRLFDGLRQVMEHFNEDKRMGAEIASDVVVTIVAAILAAPTGGASLTALAQTAAGRAAIRLAMMRSAAIAAAIKPAMKEMILQEKYDILSKEGMFDALIGAATFGAMKLGPKELAKVLGVFEGKSSQAAAAILARLGIKEATPAIEKAGDALLIGGRGSGTGTEIATTTGRAIVAAETVVDDAAAGIVRTGNTFHKELTREIQEAIINASLRKDGLFDATNVAQKLLQNPETRKALESQFNAYVQRTIANGGPAAEALKGASKEELAVLFEKYTQESFKNALEQMILKEFAGVDPLKTGIKLVATVGAITGGADGGLRGAREWDPNKSLEENIKNLMFQAALGILAGGVIGGATLYRARPKSGLPDIVPGKTVDGKLLIEGPKLPVVYEGDAAATATRDYLSRGAKFARDIYETYSPRIVSSSRSLYRAGTETLKKGYDLLPEVSTISSYAATARDYAVKGGSDAIESVKGLWSSASRSDWLARFKKFKGSLSADDVHDVNVDKRATATVVRRKIDPAEEARRRDSDMLTSVRVSDLDNPKTTIIRDRKTFVDEARLHVVESDDTFRKIRVGQVDQGLVFRDGWMYGKMPTSDTIGPVKAHVMIENAADLRKVQAAVIEAMAKDPELAKLVAAWKTMDPNFGLAKTGVGVSPTGNGQGGKGFTFYFKDENSARLFKEKLDNILDEKGLNRPIDTGNVDYVGRVDGSVRPSRVGLVRDQYPIGQANDGTIGAVLDDALSRILQQKYGTSGKLSERQLREIESQFGIKPKLLTYSKDGKLMLKQSGDDGQPYMGGYYASEAGAAVGGANKTGRPAIYALYRGLGLDPALL